MNGREQLLLRVEEKIKQLGLDLNHARLENLRLEEEIKQLKKTDQEQLLFDYEGSGGAMTGDTEKMRNELVEIQVELDTCLELVKEM